MKVPRTRYRTVWISDVHLGTKNCQDRALLRFLKSFEAEYLYLVGDIVDIWAIRRYIWWPPTHNKIIRRVMKMARQGTRVRFIPGNHDEHLRQFLPTRIGEIELLAEDVHYALNGQKLWIIHGDDFDLVTRYHRWIALLGDHSYEFLLWLNRHFNRVRAALRLGYWSLSAAIKHRVKGAVNFISDFEDSLAKEARRRGFDAVVCGHIHHAEMKKIGDVLYLNCGDWVESCTAVVEHYDGTFEVLHAPRPDVSRQGELLLDEADEDDLPAEAPVAASALLR
ncbi:MAG TPA: UDP-2,3-diacylglucosamine diphosphatase [Pelomicrobium sp.]|nr:UDP-2,3-diacylglucosamine diphosphatase [Pelomicrobium sp.]